MLIARECRRASTAVFVHRADSRRRRRATEDAGGGRVLRPVTTDRP